MPEIIPWESVSERNEVWMRRKGSTDRWTRVVRHENRFHADTQDYCGWYTPDAFEFTPAENQPATTEERLIHKPTVIMERGDGSSVRLPICVLAATPDGLRLYVNEPPNHEAEAAKKAVCAALDLNAASMAVCDEVRAQRDAARIVAVTREQERDKAEADLTRLRAGLAALEQQGWLKHKPTCAINVCGHCGYSDRLLHDMNGTAPKRHHWIKQECKCGLDDRLAALREGR